MSPAIYLRQLSGDVFAYLFPQLWLRRRLQDHRWDEIELDYLDVLVDPRRGAVDVGANAGKYAYHLAKLAPHVLALEPDARLAAKIARALPRNVKVLPVAASDRSGIAVLHFPVVAGVAQTAVASLEPPSLQGPTVDLSVEIVTLDEIVKDQVGFIKIDVEGHEYAALQGAARLLRDDRPNLLVEVEERHRRNAVKEITELLAKVGYCGFFLYQSRLCDIAELTPQMQDEKALFAEKPRREMDYVNNFLFTPRERADDFVVRLRAALSAHRRPA